VVAASPSSSSHFDLLGLTEQFDVPGDALQAAYRAQAVAWHPDQFASAPAAERVAARQRSMAINDAYQTLRSPIARAEYLLARRGVTIGDNERVDDLELLQWILERREELSEARAGKQAGDLERLEKTMKAREQALIATLSPGFQAGDLAALKRTLIELRYVGRYLEECVAALEQLEEEVASC
jgi:molecular chaperone HscB